MAIGLGIDPLEFTVNEKIKPLEPQSPLEMGLAPTSQEEAVKGGGDVIDTNLILEDLGLVGSKPGPKIPQSQDFAKDALDLEMRRMDVPQYDQMATSVGQTFIQPEMQPISLPQQDPTQPDTFSYSTEEAYSEAPFDSSRDIDLLTGKKKAVVEKEAEIMSKMGESIGEIYKSISDKPSGVIDTVGESQFGDPNSYLAKMGDFYGILKEDGAGLKPEAVDLIRKKGLETGNAGLDVLTMLTSVFVGALENDPHGFAEIMNEFSGGRTKMINFDGTVVGLVDGEPNIIKEPGDLADTVNSMTSILMSIPSMKLMGATMKYLGKMGLKKVPKYLATMGTGAAIEAGMEGAREGAAYSLGKEEYDVMDPFMGATFSVAGELVPPILKTAFAAGRFPKELMTSLTDYKKWAKTIGRGDEYINAKKMKESFDDLQDAGFKTKANILGMPAKQATSNLAIVANNPSAASRFFDSIKDIYPDLAKGIDELADSLSKDIAIDRVAAEGSEVAKNLLISQQNDMSKYYGNALREATKKVGSFDLTPVFEKAKNIGSDIGIPGMAKEDVQKQFLNMPLKKRVVTREVPNPTSEIKSKAKSMTTPTEGKKVSVYDYATGKKTNITSKPNKTVISKLPDQYYFNPIEGKYYKTELQDDYILRSAEDIKKGLKWFDEKIRMLQNQRRSGLISDAKIKEYRDLRSEYLDQISEQVGDPLFNKMNKQYQDMILDRDIIEYGDVGAMMEKDISGGEMVNRIFNNKVMTDDQRIAEKNVLKSFISNLSKDSRAALAQKYLRGVNLETFGDQMKGKLFKDIDEIEGGSDWVGTPKNLTLKLFNEQNKEALNMMLPNQRHFKTKFSQLERIARRIDALNEPMKKVASSSDKLVTGAGAGKDGLVALLGSATGKINFVIPAFGRLASKAKFRWYSDLVSKALIDDRYSQFFFRLIRDQEALKVRSELIKHFDNVLNDMVRYSVRIGDNLPEEPQ